MAEISKRPDREQFKADAERRWPSYRAVGFSGADDRQSAFMAGVDAVLSSLALEPDAREEQGQVEWGVAYRQNDGKLFVDEAVDYDDAVFRVANSSVYDMVVQRRVAAYAPVGAAPAPEAREVTDAETQAKRVLAAARVLRQAGDNAYLPDVATALEAAREVE